MPDFPSSIRASDWKLFDQVRKKGQIRTPYEGGAVQSRPRWTAARWIFTIGWAHLTAGQYDTLITFFDENLGGTFNWTHIITGNVHVVSFADEELPEAVPIGNDYWSIKGINLEETQASSLSFATTTTTTSTTSTTTTTTA